MREERGAERLEEALPMRTCATPPTPPAKRSFAVCMLVLELACSISAAASAIAAVDVPVFGVSERESGEGKRNCRSSSTLCVWGKNKVR